MTILITGGSGFIGSQTAALVRSRGHSVHVIDQRASTDTAVFSHILDVTTKAAQDAAAALHPDAIIHLAAHIDARASLVNPVEDFETNVLGTLRMLEAARVSDAAFVFSSSAAVYGDTAGLPIREDAPIQPANPYGASKASCEVFIRQYAATYGLRTVIFRYSNVFGPAQGPSQGETAVIPAFIHAALNNRPMVIFGDGAQTRDFIHVADVAEANLLALQHPQMKGTYNVGSGEEISIMNLAQIITGVCQSTSSIMCTKAKQGDIARSALDTSCLKTLMTIPSKPFHERIEETCAWYASRQEKKAFETAQFEAAQ